MKKLRVLCVLRVQRAWTGRTRRTHVLLFPNPIMRAHALYCHINFLPDPSAPSATRLKKRPQPLRKGGELVGWQKGQKGHVFSPYPYYIYAKQLTFLFLFLI